MPLRWVIFDLNGTLVDPVVLAQPLGDASTDEELVNAALDDAIRQAMVVTLTGAHARFRDLLEAGLRRQLALAGHSEEGLEEAMGLLGCMPAILEAPAALERLRGVGLRLAVLSQSSTQAADQVLRFAGLRDRIELVMSAEEVGVYKPDPRPYRMAIERTGVDVSEIVFVAAHWWDVAGAKQVGMRTGWVARRDRVLPASVPEPDVQGPDLADVAEKVVALLDV